MLPADKCLLQHVLGIRDTSKHAVCNSEEKRSMLVKRLEATVAAGGRFTAIWNRLSHPSFNRNARFRKTVAAIRFHIRLDSRFRSTLQDSSRAVLKTPSQYASTTTRR